jgi:Fe-S cluster biogenesis protein NfuA
MSDVNRRYFLESTPNPRTRKLPLGRNLASEPLEFASCPPGDAFLEKLFMIEDVTGIHIGLDFVSVTLVDEDTWDNVAEEVVSTIVEGIDAFNPTPYVSVGPTAADSEDDDVVKKIKSILDTHIRPAVANDGGDIAFRSFVDGTLTLSMRGACSGCPSSTATLKMGIENLMGYMVPEVREVVSEF